MTSQQAPTVTLSNGVKVRIEAPNLFAFSDICREIRDNEPQPPVVHIEEKGREEENPSDPEYLRALERYTANSSERLHNLMLLTGLKVVEVPDGVSALENDEWLDLLKALGLPLPENPIDRKIAWLKYVIVSDVVDLALVSTPLRAMLGIEEKAVANSVNLFRSFTQQPVDNGSESKSDNQNGNRVRKSSARSSPAV